jgi:triacylglycerol esterase/lipase EstA (alpha/beta hydrolase family)
VVIQDYEVSERPAWQLIAQETLGVAAVAALFPFGIKGSSRRTPRQRDQRTVVLVHGYLANRSALFPVAAYLRLRGVEQILSFSYSAGAGIEQAAISLREYLRQHVRGGRIDLVCHSLGGLVARVYIQELGGARRVDRCVTLGTPHRGTYNSYWLASRVGSELRPDSALLSRLHGSRQNAPGVRFLSIVAGSDNLVVPRVFASHEREIHVPDLGHVSMLFSPRVLRMVSDYLVRSDCARDPDRTPPVEGPGRRSRRSWQSGT